MPESLRAKEASCLKASRLDRSYLFPPPTGLFLPRAPTATQAHVPTGPIDPIELGFLLFSMTSNSKSSPRYQLYIYLLLLDKFFVAQDERALEASIRDVRSQNHSSFS
jgi:hypothetical protein